MMISELRRKLVSRLCTLLLIQIWFKLMTSQLLLFAHPSGFKLKLNNKSLGTI